MAYVRKGGVLGFSGVLTTSTNIGISPQTYGLIYNDPIDAENISLVNYLTGPYADPDYAVRIYQNQESTPGLVFDFLYGIDNGDTYYWYRASITVYKTGYSWNNQTLDVSFNFNQQTTGGNSNPATLPFSYSIRRNGTLITPSYISWSKDLAFANGYPVQGGQYAGEPTYVVLPTWDQNSSLSFPNAYLSLKQGTVSTTSTFNVASTATYGILGSATLADNSTATFTASVLHDFGEGDYVDTGYIDTGYITSGSVQVPNVLTAETTILGAQGFAVLGVANLASTFNLPQDPYVADGYLNIFENQQTGELSYVDPNYIDVDYFLESTSKAYYFPTFEPDVILGTDMELSVENTLTSTPTYTAGVIYEFTNPTEITALGNVDYVDSAELTNDFYLTDTSSITIDVAATLESTFVLDCQVNVSINLTETISQPTTVADTSNNLIGFGITYASVGYADPNYFEELIEERYVKTDYVDDDYFYPDFSLQIELDATFSLSIEIELSVQNSADLYSDASINVTGGYLLATGTVTQDATADFTIEPYLTGGTGVIIGSTLAQVDATFTSTTTAKNITNTTVNFDAEFTTTIEQSRLIFNQVSQLITASELSISPHHILGATISAVVEFSVPNVLSGYGIFAQSSIEGNGFLLSAGRLVIVDEYYVVAVPAETNIITTLAEPRTIQVKPETRLTNILDENRDFLVEPETRVYFITANKAVQNNSRTRRVEQ